MPCANSLLPHAHSLARRGAALRSLALVRSFARVVGLALIVVVASASAVDAAPLPWSPKTAGKPAAGPGRWNRELARRQAVLRNHRGRDPAAILALLGLVTELGGELAADKLSAFTDAIARDRRRHPLVRSFARFQGAALAEARGDRGAAEAILRQEGYLLDWQIMGPFDNTGRRGEDEVYAPEAEPYDPTQTFEGKTPGEPIGWRTRDYAGIPRGAFVSLDDLLRPNEKVTGYATCWVKLEKAAAAALHVGTGGPYAAFVDGVEVGRGSAYRVPHPLQATHPIQLHAGWNQVLIKVSALEGTWGFFARISTPQGAPLATLATTLEPPRRVASAGPAASHGATSLGDALERSAKAGGTRALDLVEFYRYTRPFDRDDTTAVELAREVDSELQSARSAWLRAITERDESEGLQSLRRAIDRARSEGKASRPLLATMLLELAWRQRSLGLESRYRALVDEAWEVAPDDAVLELALLDRAAEQGYLWLSLAWLSDLAERNPHSDSIQLELASRLHAQGRPAQALARLDALAQARGGASVAAGQRMALLLDLGRPDDAVEVAHALVATTPGLPEAHATVAKLEEARRDPQAATEALARAIALAPQDASLHATLGRLQARTGARAAAVANLRRSLELLPQQPDVRDLLARLDAKSDKDMFDRYSLELAKVASQATPPAWKGKEAGILHHRVAVKVLPNGLTERLDHRIIRILDERGVRSQTIQALTFDPSESLVEVRRARVRHADGTIEDIGAVDMVALVSAGYRMYYDQRQIRVGFPGLSVGDTLEVAFLQRDVAARNMFDEYFGDLMPLEGTEPRAKVEYILEAPAGKPIYFNVPVKQRRAKGGRSLVYRHVATDVPGLSPEPSMPGWTEVATYLHASTYKSWSQVGDWYWDLVREQLRPDATVRTALAEALEGLPAAASNADKVAAIYEYVVRNTRYVGLEFGIHGFKPYRVTEVLSRRFGDCKDKASLLKVMLEEAGIPANLVLVRTRDQGAISGKIASLAVFNHAITYVPELDLFLDGTAEWAGPAELPSNDQGASVLVVYDGKGAKYRKIPVSRVADNVTTTIQRVNLAADGSATIEHEITTTGARAAAIRFHFQSKEQRDERVSAAFGDTFAGAVVSGVAAPGIDDIKAPARLSARLQVPRYANSAGATQRFFALGHAQNLQQSLAPLATRKFPLVLDVPYAESEQLTIDLPRGFKFDQSPTPTRIETPVGTFEFDVSVDSGRAEVRSRLEFPRGRISAADYPAFRQFLRQVDATLEQTFEFAPER